MGPAISVLGTITVRTGGSTVSVPARLDRAVLVHLLLAEGRALSVDLLTDALWGQCAPPHARNALQVKISRLRRLLGPSGVALVHAQGSYRLSVDDDRVDSRVFSSAVHAGARYVEEGRPDLARRTLADALSLWRGTPWGELDDHPRLVAARLRLEDEWSLAQEVLAEIALSDGSRLPEAMTRSRQVLQKDPHRPRARLLLMRALERSGRRAEALAVYDAGRRSLAAETGLTPAVELQEAFETLLAEERRATRRAVGAEVTQVAPHGALATARWLAAEGEVPAAAALALRGAWWWWFGGERSAGRDLLEGLVGHEAVTELDPNAVLRLSAWLAVFGAVEAGAEEAIRAGERALEQAGRGGWSRHEALAAVLLGERLHQRGSPIRAKRLVRASRQQFVRDGDAWGVAVVDVVETKAALLAGDIVGAERRAGLLLRTFEELGDAAGQVMSLDVAGYAAEIRGDLVTASRTHRRALELARRTQAPEWEASQLTRLGSVLALAGSTEAVGLLEGAVVLAESIHSRTSLALAHNALGLAFALTGRRARAVELHTKALDWYERQESPAGISYSAGRLAHAVGAADVATSTRLARRATVLARRTRDPRAVAHGMEAVACVAPDPVERARALGTARAIRRATASPLPAVLNAALLDAERALHRSLGDRLVTELRHGAGRVRG